MLRKLRRFILKKTIKGQLNWYLKELNLLEGEITEFKVLEEYGWGINFWFKTENQIFKDIWFRERLEGNIETMEIEVRIDGINVWEEITFSVSKWLTITPKTYKIYDKTVRFRSYGFMLGQKIEFESGKIIIFRKMREHCDVNMETELKSFMEDMAKELFKLNTVQLTIKTDDFGRKDYWISQEIREPMLKPESKINFEQFL